MARDDGGFAGPAAVVAFPAIAPPLQGPRTEPVATPADHGFDEVSAAARGPTAMQWALGALVAVALALGLFFTREAAIEALHGLLLTVFALSACWRAAATGLARPPRRIRTLGAWPTYTVIVPLYREAAMAPGLAAALNALDYPKDRLQVIVALETDDEATRAAFRRLPPADRFQIVVAPPGRPKTKPRACNIALKAASGRFVVVYDAEDRPHPLQLKEAAARFAAGGPALACLQAPLRIVGGRSFLARQFALEYAAQFEVLLPALARLGAAFPLGGTSNHFRTSALRAVGGWDAWNVTEDADLGFRLTAQGWRTGLLRTPTWESAPTRLKQWTPQRARWIKGYMQTWGVHMRAPLAGGFRHLLALQITLGLAILGALAHGPVMVLLAADAALAAWRGQAVYLTAPDFALLTAGWGAAVLAMSAGARRAGLRMRMMDALGAPFYWALQSAAAAVSVWQLCTRPHHWDKTNHDPPVDRRIGSGLAAHRPAGHRPAGGETGQTSGLGALDAKGARGVRRAA